MKKWMLQLLACGLAVGLCTASAYAWGTGHSTRVAARPCQSQLCTPQSCAFTDADGDGLCDVCGLAGGKDCRYAPCDAGEGAATAVRSVCYGDADGDGICDRCGQAAGSRHLCRGDSDGDGICQVCGQAAGSCVCTGSGHHSGQGSGSSGDGHHGHHDRGGC